MPRNMDQENEQTRNTQSENEIKTNLRGSPSCSRNLACETGSNYLIELKKMNFWSRSPSNLVKTVLSVFAKLAILFNIAK